MCRVRVRGGPHVPALKNLLPLAILAACRAPGESRSVRSAGQSAAVTPEGRSVAVETVHFHRPTGSMHKSKGARCARCSTRWGTADLTEHERYGKEGVFDVQLWRLTRLFSMQPGWTQQSMATGIPLAHASGTRSSRHPLMPPCCYCRRSSIEIGSATVVHDIQPDTGSIARINRDRAPSGAEYSSCAGKA